MSCEGQLGFTSGVEREWKNAKFEVLHALRGEAEAAEIFPLEDAWDGEVAAPNEVFVLYRDPGTNIHVVCTREGMFRAPSYIGVNVEGKVGSFPNLTDLRPIEDGDLHLARTASARIKQAQLQTTGA